MKQLAVLVVVLAAAACEDKTGAANEEARNGGTKAHVTLQLTKKLAYEAYPTWAVKNPDKACPDKIDDLVAALDELYSGGKSGKTTKSSTKDAWGTELKMFCGPTAPADARGLAIQSAGPDATFDTADDIKSWPM